jgi:uncharacterized protein (UPF0128 family)
MTTIEQLREGLVSKTIEDISINNGITLTVEGKRYHFVSHSDERESGSACIDTYVYVNGEYYMRITA